MRRLVVLLAGLAACDSPAEPAQPPPPAPTRVDVGAPARDDPPAELTPQQTSELRAAAQTLGRGCDRDALDVARGLQRTVGDQPAVVETLKVAFAACQDPEALAELLARTTPDDAPLRARLELGAAWVRAARYQDAVDVLEPLLESEGEGSKAAWLTGFALFHAGDSERARPLLESARSHASKTVSDAWLLIGLCKLHTGETEAATAEFERGVEVVPDDPSLWSALSRAYAADGRHEDAARASRRAREVRDAKSAGLRTQMWLAARATQLRHAAAEGNVEDVERVFEQMWPDAPREIRVQMLNVRAKVYAQANLDAKAEADRAQARALQETAP